MSKQSVRFGISFKLQYENEKNLIDKLNNMRPLLRAQYLAKAVEFYEKYNGNISTDEKEPTIVPKSKMVIDKPNMDVVTDKELNPNMDVVTDEESNPYMQGVRKALNQNTSPASLNLMIGSMEGLGFNGN